MAESEPTKSDQFGEAERRCKKCKIALEDTSYKHCKACRDFDAANAKARREGLVEQGLCAQCRKPNGNGRLNCHACVARAVLRNKARPRKERRCQRCGAELPPGLKRLCETCRRLGINSSTSRSRNRAAANGLCQCCGKPNQRDATICEVCTAKRKTREAAIKCRCFAGYGGRCVCCGETRTPFLTLDHVRDDGHKQRRSGKYPGNGCGIPIYKWAIRNDFPADLQILCFSCQWGKRLCGTCPHQQQGWMRGGGEGV